MKIHDTIRLLRKHKEYSQEYMAEKLNIDTVTYGRVENGKTKLTIERLEEIAEILGFSPRKVYQLSEELPEDNENTNDVKKLLKKNIQLSEQILKEIKAIK